MKQVTRSEMMKAVIAIARTSYKMIGRFSWVEEKTWSECMKRGWEIAKMKYEIKQKPAPAKVVKVTRYDIGIDISNTYGSGIYNGD